MSDPKATITQELKTTLVDLLQKDLDSADNSYYIALGRSKAWPGNNDVPEQPEASGTASIKDLRASFQSYKISANNTAIITNSSWDVSGTTSYFPFDDKYSTQSNEYYVINDSDEVFVCVENGRNLITGAIVPSTIRPSAPTKTVADPSQSPPNDQIRTFKTSDGYHWRYLYKASPFASTQFKTNTLMPVKRVRGAPTLEEEIEQQQMQDSSFAGEILSIQVVDGGSNYSAPTVTFSGNGTANDGEGNPLGFSAIQSGGVITHIGLDSDGVGKIVHGSGYTDVQLTVTDGGSGSGAIVRPVIGNLNKDPRATLRSNGLLIKTDFQNSELNTILAENDFRTVALIRNPSQYGGGSLTANTANALSALSLTGISGTFIEDELISQAATGSQGYVVNLDGSTLYYIQDISLGIQAFDNSLVTTASGGQGTVTGTINPDVDVFSGDILYISNDSDTPRNSSQTEEIRLIVNF